MTDTATLAASPVRTEHFDVVIVGAGISGVGGAYHLKTQCPDKTFLVLESKKSFGGTWLTHQYPGIRSDSDLYTFGYRFKPWTGRPIATAEEILSYMGEVIEDNGLARHIRYGHEILKAEWSSAETRWTLEGAAGGETFRISANFLWMCQGYYRHSEGYTPEWPGIDGTVKANSILPFRALRRGGVLLFLLMNRRCARWNLTPGKTYTHLL